ncbi:MAG TPA: HK97 family phage prohead protease, partial [Propionibacteriaceae bacterium]|nr:HK97 family phage prohead protease [Propionibacteriaceae bacterium]
MTTEIRYTSGVVELRASSDGARLGGYALKFNKLSRNLGGFVERIAPGALTKTLKDGGDVLCRYQHEDEFLLGRTSSGTLRLSVDEVGLLYEVDLPNTSYARDLEALADRKDVQHSSFAFQLMPGGDDWSLTPEGFPLRTLTELHLVDVAPVVNPAYLDTTSGLRSLAESRHLDFDSVRAAAESERLADLLRVDVQE